MSAIDIVDSLANSLGEKWQPNETKSKNSAKSGTGKAVRNTGQLTPEGTPEVDDGRVKADIKRQAGREASEAPTEKGAVSQDEPSASKGQPEKSTPADDEDEDDAKEKAQVLREVLACGENEYHKILKISEEYEDVKEELRMVERAVYNRGIAVHPNYNEGKNAEKAWNMVRAAGAELGCNDSVFQEVLDYCNDGASTIGNKETSDVDAMDGIEKKIPKPSKIVLGMYDEATPLITQLQQNPKSYSVNKKLESINTEIKKQNRDEEQNDINLWLIDYKTISNFYQDVRPFADWYKKDPNNQEAIEEAKKVKTNLDDFLSSHHYPTSWTLKEDILLQEAGTKEKENQMQKKTEKTSKPKSKVEPASATSTTWRPGLTLKGERMLGMAPVETTDVSGNPCMLRCSFLIEKKGEKNPMVFEDSAKVGQKAADGYLKQLPEGERNDIRTKKNDYTPADQQGFLRIKAVATKPGYSSRVFPQCCVWAEYDDGKDKLLNRSGLRKIWKPDEADRMIEDFYIGAELKLPWMKRAKRPQGKGASEERRLTRGSESPTRGRRSSSPDRRRSSSVSTSTSSLSDEGLERLEGIEDRMTKFEKMFERMSAKIDKLQR